MILTDIHCHILPEVDDGAQSKRIMRVMLNRMYRDGVRRIIMTPHYRKGMFEPSMEEIECKYQLLKKYAEGIGQKGIRVWLGCEYHRDREMLENLKHGRRPTLAGSRYVLVEFSSMDNYRKIHNTIYELVTGGFKPIIAHIERYPAVVSHPEYVAELIDQGAMIQVNADALLGIEGWKIRRFCKKLMKKEEIDFIASDAHDLKERPSRLRECADYVERKWGSRTAKRIFVINPSKITGERGENRYI